MRYDLVIFDNDGVLVDSEPISNRILAECLTEAGFPTTTEDSVRDFMGAAMHRVHDVVRERTAGVLPEGFDDDYHARVFAAFERELVAVVGAGDVVGKLAADGVAYCLASSAGHERIRVALRKTGLYRYFAEERIFSAEDVGRGSRRPTCSCTPRARWGWRPSGAPSSRTAGSGCRRPWRRVWTCTATRR